MIRIFMEVQCSVIYTTNYLSPTMHIQIHIWLLGSSQGSLMYQVHALMTVHLMASQRPQQNLNCYKRTHPVLLSLKGIYFISGLLNFFIQINFYYFIVCNMLLLLLLTWLQQDFCLEHINLKSCCTCCYLSANILWPLQLTAILLG